MQNLEYDIEENRADVEEKGDLPLLTEANSFQVTAHSKKETLSILENALSKLNEEIKHI